jgi:hypothetical protein
MLNIGKLVAGPGAGRYYTDQVARGQEDYYAGEGEAPGVWTGGGAAALGLSGQVSEKGIVRLLEGRDPASEILIRRPGGNHAIAAFDLTLRAPKSVSILCGIAESKIACEVVAAHEAAVAQAMEYMEREACRIRRGAGGCTVSKGRGFVAAAFRHRSSRAGDPQLHTHLVLANASQGADDRWTALDGRALYRHGKTAGFAYQAALRAESRSPAARRSGSLCGMAQFRRASALLVACSRSAAALSSSRGARPHRIDVRADLRQALGAGAVPTPRTVATLTDQSRLEQDPQVLRHGLARHVEPPGDVACRALVIRQQREQLATPRLSQHLEDVDHRSQEYSCASFRLRSSLERARNGL